MDARVDFEPLLEAFGVPATVTRPAPDDDPIETVGIWLQPLNLDEPAGSSFTRRATIRVFAIRKDDVPTMPLGTTVEAAERAGDTVRTWKVDGTDMEDPDHIRALLVRAREYDA
jgi:hypothetical protein